MGKTKKISVQGSEITIVKKDEEHFISLTNMVNGFEDGSALIEKWLRNKNTIEFIGIWEQINNPSFNSPEFEGIKNQAGLNRFTLSVKKWINATNAIGLTAKTGRYGGTFAHSDIAFEFGSWLSPEFKLYLIKEFKRLIKDENKKLKWNFQRTLSKVNYKIHTDVIKENLIPKQLSGKQTAIIYANEADVLNIALFGKTAKQWRDENPNEKGNIRDVATIQQLVVLSNIESINAMLIHQNTPQKERLIQLNLMAITQMKSLVENITVKKLDNEQR